MARGSDPEGLNRVKSKEDSPFRGGKTNAGINDEGHARRGFGPAGTGKPTEKFAGTAAGYKGGK